MARLLGRGLVAALLAVLSNLAIDAATITVTNTNDSGPGSLRQAVLEANANGQADTINFDPGVFATAQTIVLTSGQISIGPDNADGTPRKLTLVGTGARMLTIDGDLRSRIFQILSGAQASIDGLTLTRGTGKANSSSSELPSGGAIQSSTSGVFGVPSLILSNSVVRENHASQAGGGIASFGFVIIYNSAIVNNDSYQGSGLLVQGELTITNSTISGNYRGAAIEFSGNSDFRLVNSTVAFNHSLLGGTAGIRNTSFAGNFRPRNSIIANNTSTWLESSDAWGYVASQGNNIIGNSTDVLPNVPGDQIGADPLLDPVLRDHGSGIPTHALRSDSTAIDRGNNCILTAVPTGCGDPAILTDQRGVVRPQDGDGDGTGTVDIGAFEAMRAEVVAATAAPDLQAASDSGATSSDNITKNPSMSFDISGATAGSTVELLQDGTLVASAVASGSTLTLSDTAPKLDGVYVYTTRQIAGSSVSLLSPGLSVTLDKTAPTVAVSQNVGQADPTRTLPMQFVALFNESVTDLPAGSVSLAGSTAGVAASNVAVYRVYPNYFIVNIEGALSSDGLVIVSVPVGSVTDIAGNDNLASTANDNSIRYDTTSPEVAINQAAAQLDPTRSSFINFTVVFNESVTGFTGADVSLAGSTANVANATKNVTGSGTTYNVSIGNFISPGGTVVASIPMAAALDAAGNSSSVSSSTDNSVFVDNVSPTVTVNQATGQSDPTNAMPVNFTVVFSEPITGFNQSSLSATGSSVSVNLNSAQITGSGTTYNVAVPGLNSNGGMLRLSVRSGAVTDAIGNLNAASTSTDNAVTIDTIGPTVTANQAADQTDPATGGPVRFTVVFGENVTGFTAEDVSFTGSTVGTANAQVEITGSGSIYTVAVSNLLGSGSLRVSVLPGAVVDAVTNPNLVSTSADNVVTIAAQLTTISGQITSASGRVLRVVRVEARLADGSTRAVSTNGFGYYRLRGIPGGRITIVVTRKTGESIEREVDLYFDVTNLDFILP
ncbi:MAG: choice-of-anchor Q domain-containing protein [Pyrinomonadaceae bacterium]